MKTLQSYIFFCPFGATCLFEIIWNLEYRSIRCYEAGTIMPITLLFMNRTNKIESAIFASFMCSLLSKVPFVFIEMIALKRIIVRVWFSFNLKARTLVDLKNKCVHSNKHLIVSAVCISKALCQWLFIYFSPDAFVSGLCRCPLSFRHICWCR